MSYEFVPSSFVMARCCVPSSGGLLEEMLDKTRDERTQAINTLVVKQDSGNWGLDIHSAKAQECISLLLCAINCLLPCTAANCICSGIALQAARKIRRPTNMWGSRNHRHGSDVEAMWLLYCCCVVMLTMVCVLWFSRGPMVNRLCIAARSPRGIFVHARICLSTSVRHRRAAPSSYRWRRGPGEDLRRRDALLHLQGNRLRRRDD